MITPEQQQQIDAVTKRHTTSYKGLAIVAAIVLPALCIWGMAAGNDSTGQRECVEGGGYVTAQDQHTCLPNPLTEDNARATDQRLDDAEVVRDQAGNMTTKAAARAYCQAAGPGYYAVFFEDGSSTCAHEGDDARLGA